jgi:hypothetical protein
MLIELAGRRPMLRRDARATGAGGSELVVDARKLAFASPLDVAAITALARRADARGRRVTVVMPTDINVASYLQRMDVVRQLPPSAQILGTIPAELRSDCSQVLVEVSPLSAITAQSLAERLGRLASARFAPDSAAAVFRSIGELIDNATSHGGSPLGAFLAAQAYTGATTGRPGFEFAVCDTGVGIREHLRRNPDYRKIPDAASAIACALRPGVTGTGEKRGYGLSDLLRVTSDGGTGRLVLRSEDGIASIVLRHDQQRHAITTAAPAISGTWAWLRSQFP